MFQSGPSIYAAHLPCHLPPPTRTLMRTYRRLLEKAQASYQATRQSKPPNLTAVCNKMAVLATERGLSLHTLCSGMQIYSIFWNKTPSWEFSSERELDEIMKACLRVSSDFNETRKQQSTQSESQCNIELTVRILQSIGWNANIQTFIILSELMVEWIESNLLTTEGRQIFRKHIETQYQVFIQSYSIFEYPPSQLADKAVIGALNLMKMQISLNPSQCFVTQSLQVRVQGISNFPGASKFNLASKQALKRTNANFEKLKQKWESGLRSRNENKLFFPTIPLFKADPNPEMLTSKA